jgi:steroid 5-alpha reductase family enzyme
LPSITQIAASCLIPTSLGFIRYEYGVSYGYGTSVALVAGLVLRSAEFGSISYWHALALLFYGVRLNGFLLYREICIPKFQKFRDQIEERRGSKGRPLAKIPFVVGCATLYACLSAPLLITSQVSSHIPQLHPWIGLCIGMSWLGFIVAAWGDLQKSIVKARNGPDTLVTGGIYKVLRHPNYTGEAIGWSCSFLSCVLAAASSLASSWKIAGNLTLATLGWIGILLVLAQAATGLEKIQEEKYGGTREYEEWIRGSWSGLTFPKKEQPSNND